MSSKRRQEEHIGGPPVNQGEVFIRGSEGGEKVAIFLGKSQNCRRKDEIKVWNFLVEIFFGTNHFRRIFAMLDTISSSLNKLGCVLSLLGI